MKKDVRVYLDDILKSCKLIAKYIDSLSESEFKGSEVKHDAVIRRLEIIGEAVKKVPLELRNQHQHIA